MEEKKKKTTSLKANPVNSLAGWWGVSFHELRGCYGSVATPMVWLAGPKRVENIHTGAREPQTTPASQRPHSRGEKQFQPRNWRQLKLIPFKGNLKTGEEEQVIPVKEREREREKKTFKKIYWYAHINAR